MTEHLRMTRDAVAVSIGACDHALRLGHRYPAASITCSPWPPLTQCHGL